MQRLTRKAKKIADLAQEISTTLHEARGGGPAARAVALTRIAAIAARELSPDPADTLWDAVSRWKRLPGDLVIEAATGGNWTVRQADLPGACIGDKPTELAARLKALNKTKGAVLLVGPTGGGKSTLAHRTIRHLYPVGRIIYLPPTALRLPSGAKLLQRILEELKPVALVFDDLPVNTHYEMNSEDVAQDERLLNNLHSLYGKVLVFSTCMVDGIYPLSQIRARAIGSLYYGGLRPGRVDIIEAVLPPAEKERAAILRHYGLTPTKEQLRATSDMTPAYLKELAIRAKVMPDRWKEDVCALKMAMPRTREKRDRSKDSEVDFLREKVFNLQRDLDMLKAKVMGEGDGNG